MATDLYKQEELCVFLDIGTNGELVIGNKDFLVVGAGAAGPALEGGVVKTGMRAEAGAVDQVKIYGQEVLVHVIGEGEARESAAPVLWIFLGTDVFKWMD